MMKKWLVLVLVTIGVASTPINEAQSQSVPPNARLNILGTGWECNKGFKRAGNECKKVEIPANASLDYLGHDWQCNKGFKRAGNECKKVEIPANASLDYLGHDWQCNKGFKRAGNECKKVEIPANASLDYLGHDWQCNKGFKRSGTKCTAMTDSEKAAVLAREKAILDEIKRRRTLGVRGNHCDTEYTSGANVCVTVRDTDLDCSKSYDGSSYQSCQVEVSLYVETDYRGRGYIDGRVNCEVTIDKTGSSGYSTSDSEDERWSFSLYANDSSSRSIDVEFSFSSYEGIRRVSLSDVTCRVRDLYVY
jgi:hypothetical protein